MCGSHLLFSILGNLGIIGDSNVRCRNISSRADTAGVVGSSCNVGSDCLYGECTINVCSAPLRQCPSENGKSQRVLYLSSLLFSFFSSFSPPLIYSSLLLYTSIFSSHIIFPLLSHIAGSPCSERGTCVYLDPSGNTLPSCTILDSKCSATCVCRTDYGGADCSISVSKLETLSSLR